jgi:hypothetical protein
VGSNLLHPMECLTCPMRQKRPLFRGRGSLAPQLLALQALMFRTRKFLVRLPREC